MRKSSEQREEGIRGRNIKEEEWVGEKLLSFVFDTETKLELCWQLKKDEEGEGERSWAVEPDFKNSNKKSNAQGACRRLYPTFAQ